MLAWGRKQNIAPMSKQRQSRVRLQKQDVLLAGETAADIILAMNFSYLTFKTREQLRAYFTPPPAPGWRTTAS